MGALTVADWPGEMCFDLISPLGVSISIAWVTVPAFLTVTMPPGATDGDDGFSLNSVSEIVADEEAADPPPPDEPLLVWRFSPQPAAASAITAMATAGLAARITSPSACPSCRRPRARRRGNRTCTCRASARP